MLLSHESPAAGQGRSYGRAHVYAESGELVASYVQENMIRAFGEGQAPAPGDQGGPLTAQMYMPPLTPMIWPVM